MSYTRTISKLEPGKLYKLKHGIIAYEETSEEEHHGDPDTAEVLGERDVQGDFIVLALDDKSTPWFMKRYPDYGQWVLLGERRFWLLESNFDALERLVC